MALQRQGRDHLAIGVRSGGGAKYGRFHRRSGRLDHKLCRLTVGAVTVFLAFALCVTVLVYCYVSGEDRRELTSYGDKDNDLKSDFGYLPNETDVTNNKVINLGHASAAHGRDSRYWDRNYTRRDEDYGEVLEHGRMVSGKATDGNNKSALNGTGHNSRINGVGLYNEAGRNELKLFEEQYEASLKDVHLSNENSNKDNLSDANNFWKPVNADDEYNDTINSHDFHTEDYDGTRNDREKQSEKKRGSRESSELHNGRVSNVVNNDDEASTDSIERHKSLSSHNIDLGRKKSQHFGMDEDETSRTTRLDHKRKPRRRKRSGCVIKFLNATAQLVEPLESRKFARFSLKYKEVEKKPADEEHWEPRFAGHQDLQEREKSFLAHDQKIKCGFVRGPKDYPSTGFDLTEDDLNYLSRCHISVSSCIFGNSDRLRAPAGNKITRLSKKNVCFVMFVDEGTLNALSSEGHVPDRMGFIGLWKIVVVKNLPFADMRRVGKIPKLLSHRLFPSARYSIWLDSKLRLQLDPLIILEYFLWRKGYEYSISNHYDRHCIWEEVERNKKLNKYNHTAIDEQFNFYRADGPQRFNASDPNKLLPSNVPEGSFIVRAHTPMSNLFSCLWFNEIDRFTPRDQLSFFYTYQKLTRMNPDKPFHIHMFKDCERRAISKLFHHRSNEKRNVQALA